MSKWDPITRRPMGIPDPKPRKLSTARRVLIGIFVVLALVGNAALILHAIGDCIG